MWDLGVFFRFRGFCVLVVSGEVFILLGVCVNIRMGRVCDGIWFFRRFEGVSS